MGRVVTGHMSPAKPRRRRGRGQCAPRSPTQNPHGSLFVSRWDCSWAAVRSPSTGPARSRSSASWLSPARLDPSRAFWPWPCRPPPRSETACSSRPPTPPRPPSSRESTSTPSAASRRPSVPLGTARPRALDHRPRRGLSPALAHGGRLRRRQGAGLRQARPPDRRRRRPQRADDRPAGHRQDAAGQAAADDHAAVDAGREPGDDADLQRDGPARSRASR